MSQFDVEEAGRVCETIIDRVSEVFVGNRLLLRKLLAAALANGHVLFEDYPGLGKTLLAKVFTRAIGSKTRRVQFYPGRPARRHPGHQGLAAEHRGSSSWRRGRCSPTCCWLTR